MHKRCQTNNITEMGGDGQVSWGLGRCNICNGKDRLTVMSGADRVGAMCIGKPRCTRNIILL